MLNTKQLLSKNLFKTIIIENNGKQKLKTLLEVYLELQIYLKLENQKTQLLLVRLMEKLVLVKIIKIKDD